MLCVQGIRLSHVCFMATTAPSGFKVIADRVLTIRLLKVHGAAFLDRVVSGLLTVDRLWLLVVLVLQASNQILRS